MILIHELMNIAVAFFLGMCLMALAISRKWRWASAFTKWIQEDDKERR